MRSLHLEKLHARVLLASDLVGAVGLDDEVIVASVLNEAERGTNLEHTEEAIQDLGGFARSLRAVGVKFFGAHWCSRCAAQKEAFGNAASELPYVEVANPDGSPNRTAISEAIESFPTWRIPRATLHVNSGLIATGLGLAADEVQIRQNNVEVRSVLVPEQLAWLTGIAIPELIAEEEIDPLAVDTVLANGELVAIEDPVGSQTVDELDQETETVIDLNAPAPDLVALAKSLDEAGVRLFGASGDFYTRQQTDAFGAAALDLPFEQAVTNDGHRTSVAIEAGITQWPTWHFPNPVSGDAIQAASERIGRDFNTDQWSLEETSASYLGILEPVQIAAVAGVELPMTTLRRAIETTAPRHLVDLANQLTDAGAVFYGSDTCPHCQAQKAEFESAALLLPYVESIDPDGSPTQAAIDAQIRVFPTWRFQGELDLETLRLVSQREGRPFDDQRVTVREDGFEIVGFLSAGQLAAATGQTTFSPDETLMASRSRLASSVASEGESVDLPGAWRNPFGTFDVNDDGRTSALDALLVINHLNRNGDRTPIADDGSVGDFLDVSGDRSISALDALQIINELNRATSRVPFIASVSTDTVYRFTGESVSWQDGFGDSGVSFRVDVSTHADCREGIVSTQMVSDADSVDLSAGLDVGTYYACVRMQTDDGVIRSAQATDLAASPRDIGQQFEVAASHMVFITGSGVSISGIQEPTSSMFGSLEGADFNCSLSAFAARLIPDDWDFTTPIWKAIISDSSETAYERTGVEGPVVNRLGELLAVDKDDLFDDELETPVRYNANGTENGPRQFWHGSSANGKVTVSNCRDWSPGGGSAAIGSAEKTNWLTGGVGGGDCDTSSEGLLCISPFQPPID